MSTDLSGTVTLITGGSRGSGGVHAGLSCFYLCASADAHYANPAIANERSTRANPM
jgi:hypothetical protein